MPQPPNNQMILVLTLATLLGFTMSAAGRERPPDSEIVDAIRQALDTGTLDRQKAILTLIPEADLKGLSATATAKNLDDYLQKTTDEECKVLALIAYGKLNPPGGPAARVIKPHLASSSVEVRRAAGKALASATAAVCTEFGRPNLMVFANGESIGSLGGSLVVGTSPVIAWIRGQTTTLLNEETTFVRFTESAKQLLPLSALALSDQDESVRAFGAQVIQLVSNSIAEDLPDPTSGGTEGRAVDPFEAKLKWLLLQPAMKALNEAAPALRNGMIADREETRMATVRAAEAVAFAHSRALASRRSPPDNLLTLVAIAPPEDPLRTSTEQILPAIGKLFQDKSPAIRLTAIEAFENFGPDARQQLSTVIDATTSEDLFVRWVAVRTLGRMIAGASADENKRIVAALASRVDDPDLDVVAAALSALAKGGEASRPATEAVLRRTNHGDPDTCILAIRTLAAIKADPKLTVGGLKPALDGESSRVRKAAVTYLGLTGAAARPAIPTLRKLLADPDEEVRKETARALLMIEKEL